MRSTLIVMNPHAGGGRHAEATRELAKTRGWSLRETERKGDARRLAAEAARPETEVLVVAGGDGTVNEVINGLMEIEPARRPTLGILPCGTANDFVKLQREGLTWDDAVAMIEGGACRRFDLARVEGGRRGYFANAATGGISSEIQEQLDDQAKQWWGRFSYFRVAAEVIPRAEAYAVRVEAGSETYEGPAMALMVANGRHAGGVELLPEADPEDHRLDVAVVRAESLGELSSLLARFAVGRQEQSAHFWMARARRIEIRSEPGMSFIGDGEPLGETPLIFEAVPGAIEICSPSSGDGEEGKPVGA